MKRTKVLTYGFAVAATVILPLVSAVASQQALQLRLTLGDAFDSMLELLPAVRAISSSPTLEILGNSTAASSREVVAMVRAASVIYALASTVVAASVIHLIACLYMRMRGERSGTDTDVDKGWRAWLVWAIGLAAAVAFVGYGMTSETMVRHSGIVEGHVLWWTKLCLVNIAAAWCLLSASEVVCFGVNRA
jgi:hypothetical protein